MPPRFSGEPKISAMKNQQAKKRRKRKTEFPYWFQMQRKVNEPAPLDKEWSVEEKESILDYLHGDLKPDEAKACCYYEYARASETLRKAQREYNRADPANSSLTIGHYFPFWVLDGGRWCFLQCNNFPNSAWRDLNEKEREHIRLLFKPISPWPIITDVRMLKARGVFDRFKQQAEEEERRFKEQAEEFARTHKNPPVWGPYPATVGDNGIRHVVITFDYREGVQAVTDLFVHWLNSDANQKLFESYYKKPIHKQNPESPDRYKELLKFLAAWRLYDEFRIKLDNKPGFKAAKEWTRQNRRQRTDALRLRRFFREKPSKQLNTKPLYRDRRDWEAAINTAKSFLAKEIEYGQRAADVG
jgi:hypothetical protein